MLQQRAKQEASVKRLNQTASWELRAWSGILRSSNRCSHLRTLGEIWQAMQATKCVDYLQSFNKLFPF